MYACIGVGLYNSEHMGASVMKDNEFTVRDITDHMLPEQGVDMKLYTLYLLDKESDYVKFMNKVMDVYKQSLEK